MIILARDINTESPKARVARPKAKWTSCTMGPGWAALRAAAKEFGCAEEEIELSPARETRSALYFATRRKAGYIIVPHPARLPLWTWLGLCVLGGVLTVALAIGLGELAYSALHLGGLVP